MAVLEQLTFTTQVRTSQLKVRWVGKVLVETVGSGSSRAAYFYHTGELTSTPENEVGMGRSWWSQWKLCRQWQPWSSLLLPHR